MLVRLFYVSDCPDWVGEHDIESIFRKSRANNAAERITGTLVHSDGGFAHLVEGDRRAIRELISKLKADARHAQIEYLSLEEIEEREFSDFVTLSVPNAVAASTAVAL